MSASDAIAAPFSASASSVRSLVTSAWYQHLEVHSELAEEDLGGLEDVEEVANVVKSREGGNSVDDVSAQDDETVFKHIRAGLSEDVEQLCDLCCC